MKNNLLPIAYTVVTNRLKQFSGSYIGLMSLAFLFIFLMGWASRQPTPLECLDTYCVDTVFVEKPGAKFTSAVIPSPKPKKTTYQQRVEDFKAKTGYTPYQVLLYYTKAKEGYRKNWYKDGIVKGRQSYSIGYGINNQGDKSLHKRLTGLYTCNGITNKALATKAISDYYLRHKPDSKNLDVFTETAWLLHCYNRGAPKGSLDRCCGSKTPGCGAKIKKVRVAHGERRRFESALANQDFAFVKAELKKCIESEL